MAKNFVVTALLALAFASALHAAEPFQVIVNADNAVVAISKTTLRDYFLGKATRWPSGAAVKPVDLDESSSVREAFSRQVLDRTVAAVRSYWLSTVFAGRGTPPVQFRTDQEVIAAVRASREAVGYVSASATLGPGVRAVPVTE